MKAPKALFVGLTTLDIIYYVGQLPASNEKIFANHSVVCTGGPAANAAITFSELGGKATLVSAIGSSPVGQQCEAELNKYGVRVIDVAHEGFHLPYASIFVERGGDRTVVTSPKSMQDNFSLDLKPYLLNEDFDVKMSDGHYLEVAKAIFSIGIQGKGILDGGSWKTGLEGLFPFLHYAICSEKFVVPADICADIQNISWATSRGHKSVLIEGGELPVPKSDKPIVDTLGAGDVLHGAFCYYLSLGHNFPLALQMAMEIATGSCTRYGTRLGQ